MDSKFKEIIEVLHLFESSEFTVLQLEFDGIRINLSKDGDVIGSSAAQVFHEAAKTKNVPATAIPTTTVQSNPRDLVATTPPENGAAPVDPTGSEGGKTTYSPGIDPGLIAIRAPTLGSFYRASSPGEPPFVEVGDRVSENDTVCLIECMKLFNTIAAGCKGTIVSIAVENANMVEFDEPLMYVRPD